MELLIGLAIILAFNEWRDYKFNRKHKALELQIKQIARKLHFFGDLAEKIDATNAEIEKLRAPMVAAQEFISKAQLDLQTIVNEYQVNGIPMGLQRGTPEQHFDAIEGI